MDWLYGAGSSRGGLVTELEVYSGKVIVIDGEGLS